MTQSSVNPNTLLVISSHILFFIDFVLLNLQTYFLYILYIIRIGQRPKQKRKSKTIPIIVISGANSGIGLETTKTFCSLGYTVFAGYRNNNAKLFLNSLNEKNLKGTVIPVQLDVCKKEQINSTYNEVKQFLNSNKESFLAGVVSNAGGGEFGPLEACTFEEMQNVFKLNYFGAIQFVQKFLYLLKKDKGRVVFIGSVASKSLNKNLGLYSAAKAALRSTSVIINAELNKFEVQVVLIEPGTFRTRATDNLSKKYDDLKSNLNLNKKENKDFHKQTLKDIEKISKITSKFAHPPKHVTYHIKHAIEAPIVKSTYLVGWDAYILGALNSLPDMFTERIRNAL